MKTINTSVLLVVLSLLPFLFSSCSEDEPSVPTPTVSIEAGDVTDNSLSFTVTAEHATKAAYLCIKKGETIPTVENILKGTSVKVGKNTAVTASNLEHNTDYTIAVAVEGEGGTATNTKAMKTAKTPDPTATLALEGEATESSFSFKVTVENATKCAYKYIKEGEEVPTAAAILADGTEITDFTKAIEVKELMHNTKYELYVAVEGKAGSALSEPLKVTTKQKVLNLEFTDSYKTGSNKNFYVTFTNSDYTLKVDFYSSTDKFLEKGTYTLAGAKDMECDKAWTDLTKTGSTKQLFTEGNVVVNIVEGNTYEITTNLTLASGEIIIGHYKGEITGITVVEKEPETYNLAVSATAKRKSLNGAIPGEYYITIDGDNNGAWTESVFDFYADPNSTELPIGEYTLGINQGVNTLDAESSNINIYGSDSSFSTYFKGGSGTVKVEKTDNIYTFTIDLVNSKGVKYKGTFTGEITNMDLAN